MKFPAFAPRSLGEVGPTLYRLTLIFILFVICYLLFVTSPTFASATFDVAQSQPNPYTVPNTNPDVPKNLHTWTQNVMIEVMSAMSCQLTGIDPTNPKSQCLGVDTKTGKIGFVQGGGGAIGVTGKMIGMLYTPPLRTGDYFKYLASNFGIAKPAHAQAAGFKGLEPVQKLWVAFRNIVYLLFVIIFVVIGLAIMLRVRIDPRTVMTIQNQIPKIIIGILLVTFSFAIAGFLIDLMYVVIFLSYELISGAGVLDANGVPVVFDKLNPLNLKNATVFTAADGIRGGGIAGIAVNLTSPVFNILHGVFGDFMREIVKLFFEGSLITKIAAVVAAGVIGGLSGLIFSVPGAIVGAIAGVVLALFGSGAAVDTASTAGAAILSVIATVIIAIALLIALIRLWFTLIMTYVGILLDVVFAPFWIAGALLPGSPIGFTAWLRSIVANLAAFPATIIMFLLAKAFIDGFGAKPAPTNFVPPLIGNFAGTDSIGAIIALGIILMTPNVVAMVKAALKAPNIDAKSIAAGFAAGTRIVSQTVTGGIGARMASQEYIPDPNAQGGFRRRGTGGAIFGRLFGGR